MNSNTLQVKKCEYNFGCEDYAEDGTWAKWYYNVEDNAPARYHIVFHDIEQNCDFDYDVCGGCLASLEATCEDDPELFELISIDRLVTTPTASYEGQRSKKYHHSIIKAWTHADLIDWIKRFHKQTKKHEGKKCDESCFEDEN